MKYKEVGGQPASGLPADFTNWLEQGLQTGSFGSAGASSQFGGANPMGSTAGISGVLNDILAGGAGKLGGSLQQLLQTQQTNDVNSLRARFGVGGGTAFGSPAAYAESSYRSQVAPQITQAIGGMQMGAISQLLPILAGLTQRGTPQAEMVGVTNPWVQAAQVAGPIIGQAVGAMAGAPGMGSMAPNPGSTPSLSMAPTDFSSMFQFNPPSMTGSSGYAQGGNWAPQNNPINFGYTPSLRF